MDEWSHVDQGLPVRAEASKKGVEQQAEQRLVGMAGAGTNNHR